MQDHCGSSDSRCDQREDQYDGEDYDCRVDLPACSVAAAQHCDQQESDLDQQQHGDCNSQQHRLGESRQERYRDDHRENGGRRIYRDVQDHGAIKLAIVFNT